MSAWIEEKLVLHSYTLRQSEYGDGNATALVTCQIESVQRVWRVQTDLFYKL